MKSLLITALAALGVAHGGAFLSVWDVPYVEDHFTAKDLGRKLNKVFKVDKFHDTLREAREEAREENLAIYDEPRGPAAPVTGQRHQTGGGKAMRFTVRRSKRK